MSAGTAVSTSKFRSADSVFHFVLRVLGCIFDFLPGIFGRVADVFSRVFQFFIRAAVEGVIDLVLDLRRFVALAGGNEAKSEGSDKIGDFHGIKLPVGEESMTVNRLVLEA